MALYKYWIMTVSCKEKMQLDVKGEVASFESLLEGLEFELWTVWREWQSNPFFGSRGMECTRAHNCSALRNSKISTWWSQATRRDVNELVVIEGTGCWCWGLCIAIYCYLLCAMHLFCCCLLRGHCIITWCLRVAGSHESVAKQRDVDGLSWMWRHTHIKF